MPMTTAANTAIDPIDRSTYPERMSIAPGMAMSPTTETFCRMIVKLPTVRKFFPMTEKIAMRMSSAKNRPLRWAHPMNVRYEPDERHPGRRPIARAAFGLLDGSVIRWRERPGDG